MRANVQLSLLAERLFPGSSYDELLRSPFVDHAASGAEKRVRERSGVDAEILSGRAWSDVRRALSESLAWMLLFRMHGERLQAVIAAWVEAQAEMLLRLAADRALIAAHFARDARRVVSLDLDLSDRHCGGRSVAILTFDSGLKLVYKPRDIGIEAWFAVFQEHLNDLGAPFPFRSLRTLSREGYGWTEFVVHSRCLHAGQLRSYYRNAGALLCLLHLLRATDCHFENLIACAESPVFIDAETLFQPILTPGEDGSSVLRTGMIPRFSSTLQAAPQDFGALSCVSPQAVSVPIPAAQSSGERLETVLLTPETSIPFPDGQDPAPEQFVEQMLEGFSQTWHFAGTHREAILEAMETAPALRIRYVVRDTVDYYQAMVAALYAGDLDRVSLPPLPAAKAVFAALAPEERAALLQMDIPRFTLAAADTGLRSVAGCFPQSGYELARRGMDRLGEKELARQTSVIRVCWGLYGAAKSLA